MTIAVGITQEKAEQIKIKNIIRGLKKPQIQKFVENLIDIVPSTTSQQALDKTFGY